MCYKLYLLWWHAHEIEPGQRQLMHAQMHSNPIRGRARNGIDTQSQRQPGSHPEDGRFQIVACRTQCCPGVSAAARRRKVGEELFYDVDLQRRSPKLPNVVEFFQILFLAQDRLVKEAGGDAGEEKLFLSSFVHHLVSSLIKFGLLLEEIQRHQFRNLLSAAPLLVELQEMTLTTSVALICRRTIIVTHED